MTSGYRRHITTAMLWYIWNGRCSMSRGGRQHVDLHALYMTLYLTSCWKLTETPGTIKAERFVTWKQFLTVDNQWNLQAILRKLEYMRITVTDWCYTYRLYDTQRIPLYSKIECTDPCDTAQFGILTPHMRKQQQNSTSVWYILWPGINQNVYRMQWDRKVGQSAMLCLTMMDYTRSTLRLPTHAWAARRVTL